MISPPAGPFSRELPGYFDHLAAGKPLFGERFLKTMCRRDAASRRRLTRPVARGTVLIKSPKA
jgi:hypothetical protein